MSLKVANTVPTLATKFMNGAKHSSTADGATIIYTCSGEGWHG